MMRQRLSFFQLSLICVSLMSCGGDELNPKSKLQSYRIIAMRADPAALSISSPVTIELYDFHPEDLGEGRPEVKYSWSLCPFSLGSITQYECLTDELDLSSLTTQMEVDEEAEASPRPKPSTSFILDATSLFAEFGDDLQEQMELFEMGTDMLGSEMDFFASGVLRVYLKLKVEIAGEPEFSAVKSLDVLLNDTVQMNQNPRLLAITADPVLTRELEFEGEVELSASFDANSAEEYVPAQSADDKSTPDPLTEKLIFSWYTTTGSFEKAIRLAEDTSTVLTLGDEAGRQRLYLTLRDGRGGVDIRMIEYDLGE